MQDMIERMMKRVKASKGIDARKLVLNELGPILLAMTQRQNAAIEATDKNFADIYATLGLGMDHADFMEHTRGVITGLSTFIDVLMVEAKFFNKTEEGMKPSEDIPKEILAAFEQQAEILGNWFEQAEIIQAELAEVDDDDDDAEESEEATKEEEATNA